MKLRLEVHQVSLRDAELHPCICLEAKSRCFLLVAIAQGVKQRASEVHLDFALRTQLDRHRMVKPFCRWTRFWRVVARLRQIRQAHRHPVIGTSIAEGGLHHYAKIGQHTSDYL